MTSNTNKVVVNVNSNTSIIRPMFVRLALIPDASDLVPNSRLRVERHDTLKNFIIDTLNNLEPSTESIIDFFILSESFLFCIPPLFEFWSCGVVDDEVSTGFTVCESSNFGKLKSFHPVIEPMSTSFRNVSNGRFPFFIEILLGHFVVGDFEHIARKGTMTVIDTIKTGLFKLMHPLDNSCSPTNDASLRLR